MARFDFLADVTCPGAEVLEAERKGIHAVVFLWVGRNFNSICVKFILIIAYLSKLV